MLSILLNQIKFALLLLFTYSVTVVGQSKPKVIPLNSSSGLKGINVVFQVVVYEGAKSIQVIDTARGVTSEAKFVKLDGLPFTNGAIEVELAGKPSSKAFETARGFVGIAFRIDSGNTKFECLYLRPTNGRAEDQVRRNHSVQYISYPNYSWQRLRKEAPEKYESYVDLEVGKWTKVKIEVQDSVAKLFVHDATQPTLIVSDLKNGKSKNGSIGLWIGSGTEAYFRNLTVRAEE